MTTTKLMRILLYFVSVLSVPGAHAQTYISLEPSLTNSPGTMAEKANISFEVGRQWDVFSVGLDVGKTNMSKVQGRDTALYLEVRPNLNVFQQGKFTNTLTPGIGFIMNAKENFIIEVTSGIEYSYSDLIHFNIFFGQYNYSGRNSASSETFFGLSIMKYFKPTKTKGLLNGAKP